MAVLLFGVAGLFGKLILLPALIIVLGRVFFASVSLGTLLLILPKYDLGLKSMKTLKQLIGLGILLAFHWFSFFYAIQLTTVALGLVTFATFPVFASLLEPLLLRARFQARYVWLALISGFGVYLAAGFDPGDATSTAGITWGVLSGLSFAFLSIANRQMLNHTPALKVAFFEDLVACIALLPALFILETSWTLKDLLLLALLGTVFTAIAHYLFIRSLQSVSTRTASLVSSLEPVFGILLAAIILLEIPPVHTIIGCVIILLVSLYISVSKPTASEK